MEGQELSQKRGQAPRGNSAPSRSSSGAAAGGTSTTSGMTYLSAAAGTAAAQVAARRDAGQETVVRTGIATAATPRPVLPAQISTRSARAAARFSVQPKGADQGPKWSMVNRTRRPEVSNPDEDTIEYLTLQYGVNLIVVRSLLWGASNLDKPAPEVTVDMRVIDALEEWVHSGFERRASLLRPIANACPELWPDPVRQFRAIGLPFQGEVIPEEYPDHKIVGKPLQATGTLMGKRTADVAQDTGRDETGKAQPVRPPAQKRGSRPQFTLGKLTVGGDDSEDEDDEGKEDSGSTIAIVSSSFSVGSGGPSTAASSKKRGAAKVSAPEQSQRKKATPAPVTRGIVTRGVAPSSASSSSSSS